MQENKNIKSESAQREEKILEFWKNNEIFKKSLEKPSTKGDFVFYEGPPTANGRPGIHHLIARAFKDAIPRYKTMRGFNVPRKAGWDTHGLPVELEVEKTLGLKSKKEIEEYGVAAFNEKCKESVWKYLSEWNDFTKRIGYWVDQENPYTTYKTEYIETVWWVIKQINERKLIYKDYKVLPWCPRCGTALSSHEVAQGYQDVKDLSVFVKFKILDTKYSIRNTSILVWTTTPWTLPGNVALAVGEKIDYVKIEMKVKATPYPEGEGVALTESKFLILAKDRLSIIEGEYEIVEEMKGIDLIGLEYEPIYPYLKDNLPDTEKEKLNKAFKIYGAEFVTTTDGSGVVHIAPMYGADDFELGTKVGLPKYHIVNNDGTFKNEAGFLAGRFVKDEEVAVDIIKDLAHRGLLFKKEKYAHSYPHCWRCKTPLLYFARDSWYIKMSSMRDELVKENEGINWEPDYIKEGRFGEWLKDLKDWAISRERFWGTPLPIWRCEDCGEFEVLGSVEDIKKRSPKSKNNYTVIRHGEAESNILGIISSNSENPHHLTELGRQQAKEAGKKIKNEKIDFIFVSPFIRAKETADILAEQIGFPKENIIVDERIREIKAGDFDGKTIEEYHAYFNTFIERFSKKAPNGEDYSEMRTRMGQFMAELEAKYEGKNILIVSHDAALWVLKGMALGKTEEQMVTDRVSGLYFNGNAVPEKMEYFILPRNNTFDLDLHKPFIDNVSFDCKCAHSMDSINSPQASSGQGGQMKRVKEVMDVWFDSGSMPFAQHHYPFAYDENGLDKEGNKLPFPADYISEGIDQTRGWFYTMHAISNLLGKGKAYKNVICLGLIMDAKGKKMSKSLGNGVDPWEMIEKYGVDTLRFWMYSVNQPGESKNFDETIVDETRRKVFDLYYNVLSFYELYRDPAIEVDLPTESNILDGWIIVRLKELIILSTEKLDSYKLLEPTRAIKDFIDDLSTWYLRRSRDRIKEGDKEAKRTLYFVLKTLAKILAPFAPFTAEDVFLKLRNENDPESVHLCGYPEIESKVTEFESELIEQMQKVRKIVSLGLEARQKSGIKVRQPLSELRIKNYELGGEYSEIIKDELNIKNVKADKNIEAEVELDTQITPDLKLEVDYREFLRAVQDLRKKENLTPSDKIILSIECGEGGKNLIQKFENELKKTAQIKELKFEVVPEGVDVKAGELILKIKIMK